MSHLLSQYVSTCRLLPCNRESEISKYMKHADFVLLCDHLGHPSCTYFPITQMIIDNVIESLKSEESAGADQKL